MKCTRFAISALLLLSPCFVMKTGYAKPVRYEVRDPAQRDLIQATSDIALEKVVALSTAISGWVEIDPDKLNDGVKGELASDARTFDSGNAGRNDFLRDRVWAAADGPSILFIPTKLLHVSKNRLADGQPVAFRVEGTLKYRGLSKVTTVLGRMTLVKQTEGTTNHRGPGNLLRVSANFDLDLTQFGFATADLTKGRLARYLQIQTDFVGSDSSWLPKVSPSPAP